MKLSFCKGPGKTDTLTIRRADGRSESIECPKQRIIPHDLMHFAVESTLKRRGFITRVREGEAAGFAMQGEPESDAVERLVEVFQGDAWSGSDSTAEAMIDLYAVTCRARECNPLTVAPPDIEAVRECIANLDTRWQALPIGAALDVELEG